MIRLRWTASARADLLDIGAYIARDDRVAARRHVERLRLRARQAAEHPHSGRIVPELGRDDLRELIEGNYRIVYRISAGFIEVLTVTEAHRLLRLEKPDDPPSPSTSWPRDRRR